MPEGDDLPPTGQPARLVPGETPLRTHNRDTVPATLACLRQARKPGGLARTSASGTACAVAAGRARGNTALGARFTTHTQPRARRTTRTAAAGARRTTRTPQPRAPRDTHRSSSSRTAPASNTHTHTLHTKHTAPLQARRTPPKRGLVPRRSGLGLARESAKAASITTNGRRTPAVGDLSQRYTPAGTRAPPAKLGRPPRRAPPRPTASVRPRRVTRILLPMDPSETTRVEAKRFVRVRRQPSRRARHGGRRAAADDALRPAGDRRASLPRASPPRSARGRVHSSAATARGR